MGQSCFAKCDEILQRGLAKGLFIQRLVPVSTVNGERCVVLILEKQGVGEISLDENQVVAVRFLDPVADSISQPLSLFASCLSLRELPIQDQFEGKSTECGCQPVT